MNDPNNIQRETTGGDIKPHDVTITIKFRDGDKQQDVTVPWELIRDLKRLHGESAIHNSYEMAMLHLTSTSDE